MGFSGRGYKYTMIRVKDIKDLLGKEGNQEWIYHFRVSQ